VRSAARESPSNALMSRTRSNRGVGAAIAQLSPTARAAASVRPEQQLQRQRL
jgi:hypothetical protein